MIKRDGVRDLEWPLSGRWVERGSGGDGKRGRGVKRDCKALMSEE